MPEGDTIHRTANRLRPVLEGQSVVRFEAPRLTGDRPKPGDVIEAVEAVGKNLLVRFPRQLVLHTHMKMTGSWHIYRNHERWQEPAHLARAVIEVPGWVAVCFAAPTVRTWRDIAGPTEPVVSFGPRPVPAQRRHRPRCRTGGEYRRSWHVDSRGPARPAHSCWHRQRVQERSALGMPGVTIHADRARRARDSEASVRNGEPPATSQPYDTNAHHSAGRPRGIRTPTPTMSSVSNRDPGP